MAAVKNAKPDSPSHVAIKVVRNDGYAEREANILSELMKYSHPNIVKFFGMYEPQKDECARQCLVLSLACGPTLKRPLLNSSGDAASRCEPTVCGAGRRA